MKTPRPTTLVHPVTGVGSFFAFGGRREEGLVVGGRGSLWIAVVAECRDVVPVYFAGYAGGRVRFYDFRACEIVGEAYWGICLDWCSCARTVFLVRRAEGGGRRMVWEVAVCMARCSGFSARRAVGGSRRTFGMGRRASDGDRRAFRVKIRAVQPARRTVRVVRWSFQQKIGQ